MTQSEEQLCRLCYIACATRMCARCRTVFYCSGDKQRSHMGSDLYVCWAKGSGTAKLDNKDRMT
jgi:hypothetical protein